MRKSLFAAAMLAVASTSAFAADTVVDLAIGSKDHTTLVAAVTAAGLVDTLKGAGPFTVFAPTNDAFAALPAGTVDTLLKPESKDQLTKILTCHVVPAAAMAADVAKMITDGGGMAKIKTVGGCELTAKVEGDKVMIMDEAGGTATVTAADLKGSNGVIHVIDKVLLPKS
jgi:uncharacterized surface protein with fasciclin (FAS1) repeats